MSLKTAGQELPSKEKSDPYMQGINISGPSWLEAPFSCCLRRKTMENDASNKICRPLLPETMMLLC